MDDEPDWSSLSVVELLEKAQEIAKQACGKSLSSYAFIDRALDKMLNGTKDGEELTELMGKAQRVYQIIIEQQGITQITETLSQRQIVSRRSSSEPHVCVPVMFAEDQYPARASCILR